MYVWKGAHSHTPLSWCFFVFRLNFNSIRMSRKNFVFMQAQSTHYHTGALYILNIEIHWRTKNRVRAEPNQARMYTHLVFSQMIKFGAIKFCSFLVEFSRRLQTTTILLGRIQWWTCKPKLSECELLDICEWYSLFEEVFNLRQLFKWVICQCIFMLN